MTEFLLNNYLWLKALHLIAVMTWMAGMLYLPRLYVYHADAKKGSQLSETLKVMEKRLLRIIINPSMVLTFILGGLMLWVNWDGLMVGQGWMHAKLVLVILMSAMHGFYARWRKEFERDENKRSGDFYRLWNEVPTLMMIAIVIFVIVKPF